jgi:uncharacterized protein YcfJ
MRYLKITMALPVMMTAILANQAMADDYFDTAAVISAVPQTERINTPRQECRTEIIRESGNYGTSSSPAGAIIGGVAGGLLGNTIGKGGGRVASAAIGAGVGAVVGDRMANQSNGVVERPVDRCVTVDNWQTVNRGYFVTYRYNGRDYTTVTNEAPGSTIRVRIGVNAADSGVYAAPAVNQVTYYPAQPATVIYRDPVRVYAPPPVMIYGGGGYQRDFDRHGWGHGRSEHYRW